MADKETGRENALNKMDEVLSRYREMMNNYRPPATAWCA